MILFAMMLILQKCKIRPTYPNVVFETFIFVNLIFGFGGCKTINNSPENRPSQTKNGSYSNHPFPGANLLYPFQGRRSFLYQQIFMPFGPLPRVAFGPLPRVGMSVAPSKPGECLGPTIYPRAPHSWLPGPKMAVCLRCAWRIIPLSKYLVTTIYKPWNGHLGLTNHGC